MAALNSMGFIKNHVSYIRYQTYVKYMKLAYV